ncbi:hypothetical protein, partial [Bradyrhizobium elkanii]|uniref:hypothetical protein n=1 Tax=Bradyrhizobium elkanii TaxID=29448 RepID=UPI001AEC2343
RDRAGSADRRGRSRTPARARLFRPGEPRAGRRRASAGIDSSIQVCHKVIMRLPFFYGWVIVAVTYVTATMTQP